MPPPPPHGDAISSAGIDLAELETFLAVAETGSFSQAAERMHITQPSVTGRIQRLEAALGTSLLKRTTRRVDLTEEGERTATATREALSGLRDWVGELRQRARRSRQRVAVAATPMLAAMSMPAILHAYAERFPDVQVDLLDVKYSEALAALDSGEADLAVMSLDEISLSNYDYQHLWNGTMVLVVPSIHPLAGAGRVGARELAFHPLMLIEQYMPVRARIAEAMERQGFALPRSRMVGSLNTLMGMLDARMGITLLPHSIAERCHDVTIVPLEIEGLSLTRRFGVVFPRKAELSAAGVSFCQFLGSAVAGEEATLPLARRK
ncbi:MULTISPECIES: LysR family transcriptional regulator [Cupriavidus]